jgi:hypothetical protein
MEAVKHAERAEAVVAEAEARVGKNRGRDSGIDNDGHGKVGVAMAMAPKTGSVVAAAGTLVMVVADNNRNCGGVIGHGIMAGNIAC